MGVRKKLWAASVCVAVLIAPTFPLSAGAAEAQVEFEGSGWGHGVGLSQYGARAMAVLGYDYDEILGHYFKGTSLLTLPADRTIWVNLERNFDTKVIRVLNVGSGTGASVSISSEFGSASAVPNSTISLTRVGSGCTVEVANPGTSPVSITDPSGCVFDFSWYAWNQSGASPTTKIQIDGCTLPDWNTPGGTVWRPCQYARGQLHLRQGSGGLHLSAEMLIDDYIYGISEVPITWETEALKAQAVAARSYAEGRRLIRLDLRPDTCWCHVMDTTSDQRYVGWGHTNPAAWIAAAQATARQVLTHPASNLSQDVVTAFYSSSSGGATEYGHIKGYASSQVEWLSSVDDSWAVDGTISNPNASWTKSVDPTVVAGQAGLDFLISMEVSERRPGSNSAAVLEITGISNGDLVTVHEDSSWARGTFDLKSEYFEVNYTAPEGWEGDEVLLYRTDGLFKYNRLLSNGTTGGVINSGSNYTTNWKAVAAIDLDGDAQDEIFFYRNDGLYRYYDIHPNGQVGSPIRAGSEYTSGWDSITAVDLDGDGQDEIFFYRGDGLYRYYDIHANGVIGTPIRAGSEYTDGWDSITALDMDGDGQDEMFFYREDGLYRYYDIHSNGAIGSPIRAGNEYTKGWDSITAVDLDGDGRDEMFFYRADGLYRYYDVRPNGTLSSPLTSGSNFATGWSVTTAINLDGQ
jgi:SpoIID/LytB domain protein